MTLNEYQEKIQDFVLPTYGPEASVMGLIAETGEVAAIFQKLLRGDFPVTEAGPKLSKELGDVLWHVAKIADDNGWTLAEIAQENIEKLTSRKIRSVIMGNGDNR